VSGKASRGSPSGPVGADRGAGARVGSAEPDEQRALAQAYAGVRPWRRGAPRISSLDFPMVPKARRPGAHSGGRSALRAREGGGGVAFGVSEETVWALRHGRFGFEAECDLHGLRVEGARRRLLGFVAECVRQGVRAARVICGRGVHSGSDGPVLPDLVAHTLARPPVAGRVLAFAPTSSDQGGEGAVAVLFRVDHGHRGKTG
jgi:hypothetical protein